MNLNIPSFRQRRWPFLILGAVILWAALAHLVIGWLPREAAPAPLATLSVPEGQAGKVGDIAVTTEALQLAEIKLSEPMLREVAERLAVTGEIQTGGERLAKVTPQARGKVVRLLVREGDTVRADQPLALLDSAELAQAQAAYRQAASRVAAYESNLARQRELARLGQFGNPQVEESRTRAADAERGVQQAESDLADARTALVEATSEVQLRRTDYDVQQARVRRAEAVKEIVSTQDLERMRADRDRARAGIGAAQSALQAARTRVSGAERGLALARKQEGIARTALAREEQVLSGGHVANRELMDAESALDMARVDLDAAAESVRLLGGTPGSGSQLQLRAPIGGTVQAVGITLGESVDPEHVAFTVVDLEEVWARLAVPARELPQVRVGDEVELQADSAPGRTFRGRVSQISPATDETTRAVYIRAKLSNPGATLKTGSYVSGSLITDRRVQRVTVPEEAVQEHTGKPTVYVDKGEGTGAFEVRHVLLGTSGEGWREISEGLKPGERLAVSGTFYLKSEALKSSLSDGCCAVGE